MTRMVRGKAHGKTIELDEDLGVPDGQDVEVQITVISPAGNWGQGIRAPPKRSLTIPTGMASWKRFMRPARLSADLKRRLSDAPFASLSKELERPA